MKAVTICQPFAALIARGEKRVENRTWPTRYRGELAIHAASLGRSKLWCGHFAPERMAEINELPCGAIIATARLVGCLSLTVARSPRFDEQDWVANHEHTLGPWCWILSEVRELSEPIECNGRQGMWNVSAQVMEEINRQFVAVI